MHQTRSFDRNDSVAPDNLLLHLPFNETNGSIAYDHSGRANHGKLIDQASWSMGKNEGAISFDGRNDGLVFEKVAGFDRPDVFTVAFWFKRDGEMEAIPTNHQIDNLMLAQSSSFDNDNIEIGSEGTEIEIYLDSGNGGEDQTYTTSGASISNGTWHHLVVTYGSGLRFMLMELRDSISLPTLVRLILLRTLLFRLGWAGFFGPVGRF